MTTTQELDIKKPTQMAKTGKSSPKILEYMEIITAETLSQVKGGKTGRPDLGGPSRKLLPDRRLAQEMEMELSPEFNIIENLMQGSTFSQSEFITTTTRRTYEISDELTYNQAKDFVGHPCEIFQRFPGKRSF